MAHDHPPDPPGLHGTNDSSSSGARFYRTPSPPSRAKAFNQGVHTQETENPSSADTAARRIECLTVVSMNIAAFEPSGSAPDHWSRQMSIDAIRAELLEPDPDIIALQEFPGGMDRATEVFPSYRAMGAAHSHADRVVLLARDGMDAEPVPTDAGLPAVVARLERGDRQILVASVHLAPFDGGERKRKAQVESLLRISSSMSMPILVAGDTNMRDREDSTMENDLNLLDIWKLAGGSPDTQFTWDTVDHRRDDGGTFNQYYGPSTRQYRRRYDRMYMAKTDSVEFAASPTFELVANHPMTTVTDFLSDHFGMSSRLQLSWTD